MKRLSRAVAISFALLSGAPVLASPVTLDFADAIDQSEGPTIEDGFRYNFSFDFNDREVLLLSDDGSLTESRVTNVRGRRFDLVSADLDGFTQAYLTPNRPFNRRAEDEFDYASERQLQFNNLGIYGERNGVEVAAYETSLTSFFDLRTVVFGPEFQRLDAVEFRLLIPNAVIAFGDYPTSPNTAWCDEWCTDVGIDNVHVTAAVPLPASGLMLVAALGLLALRRRA